MALFVNARRRLSLLRGDAVTTWMAVRHPETPTPAKLVALGVVLYLLSPVDLIADVVPLLGIADDLLLVPLGMKLALNLTPAHVVEECRIKAERWLQRGRQAGRVLGALLILAAALAAIWAAVWIAAAFAA